MIIDHFAEKNSFLRLYLNGGQILLELSDWRFHPQEVSLLPLSLWTFSYFQMGS